MNTKKLMALAFALLLVVGTLVACQGGTPPVTAASKAPAASAGAPAATTLTPITVSVDVMEAEKCGKNAKSDFVTKQFGITFKYIPVDWGTWNEKIKTMVSANGAPDLTWWDLKGASSQDFKTWVKGGAFRDIPVDKISAQPEIKKLYDSMESIKSLTIDGKLYAWPASRNNPPILQNTYASYWVYRRDWAKAVNLYKEGDVYTYEEWVALCKKVITDDPGKNGAGNTAGLVMAPWAFPHAAVLFIGPVVAEGNETCSYIKGADGKYVWPPSLPAYKDNVLKTYNLYKDGVIWKDNVQFKAGEDTDLFKAGRAFAKYAGGANGFNDLCPALLKAGLIKTAADVGPAIITFDSKFYLTQTEDFWTVTAFSNKVDDAKLERVLSLWNYLNSKDGQLLQWLGFKDKDYTLNADGTVKILWLKDAKTDLWINPYSEIRTGEFTMAGLTPPTNPANPAYGALCDKQIQDYIAKSGLVIKPLDYKVSFFSAPNKDKFGTFGSDCKAKLTEFLQASKTEAEMGANWDAWVTSMMPKVQPVLDEINNGVK